MSYKISFIEDDESSKEQIRFNLESEEEFEFVDIPLYRDKEPIYRELEELEKLVKDIFNSKLDAIIIDYSFIDRSIEIRFNGAQLAEEIRKEMPGFPIFVLSAKEEAERFVSDVNLVYNKGEYNKDPKKLNNRIKIQIGHYRKKISDAEKRLKELLKKQEDGKLTLNEEEELIELDDFLESTQLRSTRVPSSLKKITNTEKLDKLILDTEKLIEKIEKEGKDA